MFCLDEKVEMYYRSGDGEKTEIASWASALLTDGLVSGGHKKQ